MKWERVKLSSCCISIADGDHQPPPKAEAGIPFVTISNIENNRFNFSGCMYVPQSYYDGLHQKRKPQKDDILYSVVGSFGIPVLNKDNAAFVFQRHIAILRPDKDVVDPAYMYYAMLNRDFYLQADTTAIGAAQRTISLSSLQRLTLPLPDLPTQHRIASILSAYDDLIENNRRQTKLLEEAAQRLYREWFVELRFPGHEDVKIVDGVPEGWRKDSLGSICTLKKDSVSAGMIPLQTPYIGLEHMPRADFCLSTWGNADDVTSNKFQYKEDDIIFGKIRPYFHKVGFTLNNGVVSTDSFVLNANDGFWGLLLMTVSDKLFVDYTYQTCKEGAKMPRADWNQMMKYPVLIPSESIRLNFEEFVWNSTRRIKVLALQNHALAEARDRLLPKMMSGEMEV